MSEPWLRDPNGHPPAEDLLLHFEEPDTAIEEHVAACPECRDRCRALRRGEEQFAEFHHLHQRLAPPPPPVAELEKRLAGERRVIPIRSPWLRRALAAAASAAAVVLILTWRDLQDPRSVAAAELLDRATRQVRQAQLSQPHRVRHFEARQANHILDHVDPALLAQARIRREDPLNPSDFAGWRDAQADKRDTITRGDGWVRLSTAVLGTDPLESESLTVDSRDWHPLARAVQLRGQAEIEFREVSETAVPPSIAAAAGGARAPSSTAVETPSTAAPAAPMDPREADADAREVQLWEALHATGADVVDSARLRVQDGAVCVEAWAEGDRAEQLRRVLKSVSGAAECRTRTGDSTARTLPPLAAEGLAQAPWGPALLRRFGTQEQVDHSWKQVLDRHVVLLARITALERYLRWFTPRRLHRMDPALHRRVQAIAADQVAAIRQSAPPYLESVQLILTAVQPTPPTVGTARSGTGCGDAATATSLADDLRRFQYGLGALATGLPSAPADPEALLRTTLAQREALARRLEGLCVTP